MQAQIVQLQGELESHKAYEQYVKDKRSGGETK